MNFYKKKHNIILDIDHTLVHSVDSDEMIQQPLRPNPCFLQYFQYYVGDGIIRTVFSRPYLQSFLTFYLQISTLQF
jgi:hypothetical protein